MFRLSQFITFKGKLLGFVHVDKNCVWAYDSLRKWRSYDYCVIMVWLQDHSPHTLTYDYAWNVYEYDNIVVVSF